MADHEIMIMADGDDQITLLFMKQYLCNYNRSEIETWYVSTS